MTQDIRNQLAKDIAADAKSICMDMLDHFAATFPSWHMWTMSIAVPLRRVRAAVRSLDAVPGDYSKADIDFLEAAYAAFLAETPAFRQYTDATVTYQGIDTMAVTEKFLVDGLVPLHKALERTV